MTCEFRKDTSMDETHLVSQLTALPYSVYFIIFGSLASAVYYFLRRDLRETEKALKKLQYAPPIDNDRAKREQLSSQMERDKKQMTRAWLASEIFTVAAFLAIFGEVLPHLGALSRYFTGQTSAGYSREVMLQASREAEREGMTTLTLLVLLIGMMLISAIAEYSRGRARRIRANLPADSGEERDRARKRAAQERLNFLEALTFIIRKTVILLVGLILVFAIIEFVLPALG